MYSDEDEDPSSEAGDAGGHDKRLEELWSRKKRRRSSALKLFFEDQLDLRQNPKIVSQLRKYCERYVLMSACVIKINRKCKMQDRWLMVTDGSIYNIEPSSSKIRRRIPLAKISHISASLLNDNFFIIHVPLEYDYVYVSGRKTEAVSILRQAYQDAMGEELTLKLGNEIDYHTDKDQIRKLVFQQGDDLDMSAELLVDELIKIVTNSGIKFSAIMTLRDVHLVAVAVAAEKLGILTEGSEVYRNIRDKEKVRALVDSPVLKYRIKGIKDLSEAAKTVGFPAVLKPVQGNGSLAVHLVKSFVELPEVYSFLKSKLSSIKSILGGIPDFVLEQYIEGSEHNVDMILQNGETLFAAVSDDQPGEEPWFQESHTSHPSKLMNKDQNRLIDYAIKACSKLNLLNGVVHVELKFSKGVARLLEVNARMGGYYTSHGVKAVWGVELLQHAYEKALGLPVSQLPNRGSLDLLAHPPTMFAVAKYVNAPLTGYIQTDDFLSPLQHKENISLLFSSVKKNQKVIGPKDDVPNVLGLFFVTGTDSLKVTEEDAEKALQSLAITNVLLQQPVM